MNKEIQNKPGFLQLTYKYTRALSKWIKAGRPIRDSEEILEIFTTKCRPCEAYDENSSSCQYCGCRVNTQNIAPLNKIAMATETCPDGKW